MENPYHHPEIKPHKIDSEKVRLIIFEIFNILNTGQSLIGAGLVEEDEEEQSPTDLQLLFYSLAESELSNKLLQLAMYTRTLDDIFSYLFEDKDYVSERDSIEKAYDSIGITFNSDIDETLSIRETCNKIIHAYDIRPIYTTDDNKDGSPNWGMTGEIELQGKKNDKEWLVSLYIFEFIEAVLNLLKIFDKK